MGETARSSALAAALAGIFFSVISCIRWHAQTSASVTCSKICENALLREIVAESDSTIGSFRSVVEDDLVESSLPRRQRRDGFRVASWNLRIPFPEDDERGNSWRSRRPYVAQAIRMVQPDILGLQEDCFFMNEELLEEFGLSNEYERYGLFNRNGEDGNRKRSQGRGREGWPENVFTK